MSKVSLIRYWLQSRLASVDESPTLGSWSLWTRDLCLLALGELLVEITVFFFLYRTNRNMIFFWGLCRKLYCTGVGLWNHPFLWIGIYVNQPQCLGWDGMFPVGRLATSASKKPSTSAQRFCSWNIRVSTYTWLTCNIAFLISYLLH